MNDFEIKKISSAQWMRNALFENDLNYKVVGKMYDIFISDTGSGYTEPSFRTEVCHLAKKLKNTDYEITGENVNLAKRLQKQQDLNRIKGKAFREYARIENAVKSYSKEIVKILKSYDLGKSTIEHESKDSKCGGIIQLSDLHFNELVNVLGNNYDFEVAAKRLKLFCIQAKKYFIPLNIKSVLLCFTGDILNSDRRLDELLNQSTNRADASMLAFYLLKQFILELNQDFNISIASVSGNESRMSDEMGYTDIVARDNYDYTIENLMKVAFGDCPGIKFIDGAAKEKVVSMAGQNILLLHGECLKRDTQKSIEQKIGTYALRGIMVDYVLYGHTHSAYLSDFSSRSSSMTGSNSYNEYALNLLGRASQNIFIFYADGNRDSIKIDLQNTKDIKGYEIKKELEKYNCKSSIKANSDHRTIMEIII
jgi:predicted phosphodiesterase